VIDNIKNRAYRLLVAITRQIPPFSLFFRKFDDYKIQLKQAGETITALHAELAERNQHIANMIQRNYVLFPVLGEGERYDPILSAQKDFSHVKRYEFASSLLAPSDYVVDLACGTGYGTKMMSEFCRMAKGVDVSIESIDYARRTYYSPNISFEQKDFFQFRETPNVLVSFETIEHLSCEIDSIVERLANMSDRLFVCSVPYMEAPGLNRHHKIFNIDESKFNCLLSAGKITFYYQDVRGRISEDKLGERIQNMIVVFKKR
jgi:SAM-dependent methyltransferase